MMLGGRPPPDPYRRPPFPLSNPQNRPKFNCFSREIVFNARQLETPVVQWKILRVLKRHEIWKLAAQLSRAARQK